jgi:hypothetical protein
VVSRQELAEGFQVTPQAMEYQHKHNQEELESHGLSIMTYEQAKQAGLVLHHDYNYPRGVAVYTPTAAVVSAMMLTTSPVTPQIRAWIVQRQRITESAWSEGRTCRKQVRAPGLLATGKARGSESPKVPGQRAGPALSRSSSPA